MQKSFFIIIFIRWKVSELDLQIAKLLLKN